MATPDFIKPGMRPSSPAPTVWFEFLLNPELLSKHLDNPYAVPGPHQLIIQFLQQAKALELSVEAKMSPAETLSSKDQQQPTVREESNSNGKHGSFF